uniref:Uncharacterized protein n=1 Tax=Rhizophora mucronata TaxID=61149 RepID=A0A2P2JIR6_RHIMU
MPKSHETQDGTSQMSLYLLKLMKFIQKTDREAASFNELNIVKGASAIVASLLIVDICLPMLSNHTY